MRPTLRNSSLLLIVLLLAGCHAGQMMPTDPQQKVQAGLKLFQDFRLNGVVEVKAGSFSLRKDVVIANEAGAFEVNVIDKGIFGMMPAPLFHLRADSVITVDSSLPISFDFNARDDWQALPRQIAGELLAKSDSIAAVHRCHVQGVEFSFDENLRIVKAAADDFTVYIAYRNGEFDNFHLFRGREPLASITVYEVHRGTDL